MSLSDAVSRFSTSRVPGKSAGKRMPHVIKPGRFPKFVHLSLLKRKLTSSVVFFLAATTSVEWSFRTASAVPCHEWDI